MTKTFPIELDEALHKRLKIAAIEEGVTLHDLIVKALEERVGGYETRVHSATKRQGNHERTHTSR